ncbi:MAG: hypothetical protein ACREQ5_31365 [Candidatus Dormibacteria bacterium]
MLGSMGLGKRLARLMWLPFLSAPIALLAGCTSATQGGATVPIATSVAAGATDVSTDYSIPTVIKPAYVQRVLNGLESVNAQATQLIVKNNDVAPSATKILRAVNSPESYPSQLAYWVQVLSTGQGVARYLPGPGVVQDHLQQVVSAGSQCIFAAISRDYSSVEQGSPSPVKSFVALRPRQAIDDPGHLNPTPWVFDFIGNESDGSPVNDPCPVAP